MTPASPAAPGCSARRGRGSRSRSGGGAAMQAFADERAARGEAAAGWRVRHVRHHALDGGEMRRCGGRAAESSRAGRRCRDAAALANSSSTGARSTISPAYITATSSQTSATTPRSWVIRMIAAPLAAFSSRIRSRICACRVTSSAVVGSSAISRRGIAGQRHRDHHALAHAAGELVRIFVDALFGRGDVDAAQQLDGALARLRAASRRDGAGWSR